MSTMCILQFVELDTVDNTFWKKQFIIITILYTHTFSRKSRWQISNLHILDTVYCNG